MRRLISSILTLIIIMTSLTVSFADGSLNKISLKENGIGRNFQVVNLKIDGRAVKSEDVPPVIYPLNNQGRTLVPLRMIIDNFGDKLDADIEWDGVNYEVKVTTKDKTIILKIDSPVAMVNGVAKNLPDNVPAKLLAIGSNGRTMVPIRFFAEELGLKVNWDEKTWTASIDIPEQAVEKPNENTNQEQEGSNPVQNGAANITDIRVEMNGSIPQIRIKSSKKISYNEFKLVNPDRVVIDFDNSKFNISDKTMLESNGTLTIQANNDLIKYVRMSQFSNNPLVTRVVMELGNSTQHAITYDDKTGEYVIDFINYVRNVKSEIVNTKEVVIIEGDSLENYNIMQLNNPERIVVDIKGGVLHNSFKNKNITVDGRVVNTIRISQYEQEQNISNEKTVRVVLDLQEGASADEIYAELANNKLYLHLEGEPFKAIKYEETGWTTSRFTLLGSTVTRYSINRQTQPNLLEVTVPKADIQLETVNLQVDDHIIKSMDISEDKTGNNYNIKLELQDAVEYNLASSENTQNLVLELNNKTAKYREMLVVIDPGHGGSDPGAISLNKVYESGIVLDIAIRLNQLLTEAGFRTYMTRVDDLNKDLKLELQERVDVANQLGADLFVSIHANSFTNSAPNGLENYYHPNDAAGKQVAQIFQDEMLKHLDIGNRGARQGDLFVLRNTTMPSVLTETGYLSNPSDEAKLVTSAYRQQVAEAMFKSTVRYFEQTR